MKVTCNVIKDILPLYIENMLSDDTRAIVEEHIEQCKECKVYLDGKKTINKIPMDTSTFALLKIKSNLHKKRIQTIILSIMLSVIVVAITMALLTAPEYIPYSEKSVTINEIGNNSVMAIFNDKVQGYNIISYKTEDNTGYFYDITTWNSIWNRKIKKSNINNTILNPTGENVVAVYYYQTDGSDNILIYGKEINPDGGIITLPRLFLSFYSFIAVVLTTLCGLILILFRRNNEVFNFTLKFLLLPVSYLLGHLIIKGFTTSSYTVIRDFYAILLVMIPLYIVLLIVLNLIREYKTKKM